MPSYRAVWHIPWMHEYATPISTGRVSMVEVRGVEDGLLSSVFGERHVASPNREVKWLRERYLSSVVGERLFVSPKTEVWGPGRGVVSSVFGERLVVSPKAEVKKPIDGNLSSVFGDGCVIRRTRKFRVWRTCLYSPHSATYSHTLLLVRLLPVCALYSRDLIRDLPPQSSSITSIHNLHPHTLSHTLYPRNLYPHG